MTTNRQIFVPHFSVSVYSFPIYFVPIESLTRLVQLCLARGSSQLGPRFGSVQLRGSIWLGSVRYWGFGSKLCSAKLQD